LRGGSVSLLGDWCRELGLTVGGLSREDAIDLEEPAGGRIAEGWFEIPEVEALRAHGGTHLREEELAFVERQEGHLELHSRGAGERVGGSAEDLGLKALDVELEEDCAGVGVVGEYVVEAVHRDLFSLDVLRLRSGGEVRVQHRKDGAGEGIGGDVDLDLACCGAECHTICDCPKWIGGRSFDKLPMGRAGGFEGEDSALVAVIAYERCKLARVSTHVDEEINIEEREEFAVTQLLRAVEAGFVKLQATGFCERTEHVMDGHKHPLQFQGETSSLILRVAPSEWPAG
jgi:hypothetical protein